MGQNESSEASARAKKEEPAPPYTMYSYDKSAAVKQEEPMVMLSAAPIVNTSDPILEKLYKLPTFVPMINPSRPDLMNTSFDELHSKGIASLCFHLQQYHRSCSQQVLKEQGQINKKIKNTELLSNKAAAIFSVQSSSNAAYTRFARDVQILAAQVTQTQNTVNRVKDLISQIEYVIGRPDDPINIYPVKPASPIQKNTRSRSSTMDTADKLNVWVNDVIPKWHAETSPKDPQVRALYRSGIPAQVRGQVWRLAIGNKLGLTFASLPDIQGTDVVIAQDVSRTLFAGEEHQGDPILFQNRLKWVLMGYSLSNPSVGYVQGMSYIAAMLLHYMTDFDSFCCMRNLLENPFMSALYSLDMDVLQKYLDVFDQMLVDNLPSLHKHFQDIGLMPQHFLLQWWMPIYSKVLPFKISGRVWDCFLIEGESFLFLTAIGFLKLYKKTLKQMDLDECKKLLSTPPRSVSEEELFGCIEACRSKVPAFFDVVKTDQ